MKHNCTSEQKLVIDASYMHKSNSNHYKGSIPLVEEKDRPVIQH